MRAINWLNDDDEEAHRFEIEGIDTPWGRTQHTKELAPGITLVSTSSHGGIILDKAHARRIP